jgi:hypothetical protein
MLRQGVSEQSQLRAQATLTALCLKAVCAGVYALFSAKVSRQLGATVCAHRLALDSNIERKYLFKRSGTSIEKSRHHRQNPRRHENCL